MCYLSATYSFLQKYADLSKAWDLNEDRIREWQVTFRIPFFRGINIVLPLSY
jgi:hypothetical protein